MFFDLQLSICERFPSMSPFDVRREKAYEVFLLINRLNDNSSRQIKKTKKGKKVIRRKAGDNWF